MSPISVSTNALSFAALGSVRLATVTPFEIESVASGSTCTTIVTDVLAPAASSERLHPAGLVAPGLGPLHSHGEGASIETNAPG